MLIDAFKKHWPIITAAADDDDDDDADTSNTDVDGNNVAQQSTQPDLTTMQTLVDGTAQALCLRLWKGYVDNNLANFPAFMQQVDGIVTQYVQSLPVPINQDDLEDGPNNWSDLPSIGPETDES